MAMKKIDLKKVIAHMDMNTFFVSVERLKDPSLIGKPVVVGGSPHGRGVVSAASYEARQFGIHSAMPMAQAVKACADLVIVSGRHTDYSMYSKMVKKILGDFSPLVEMASIDEGYIDLTGTEALWGPPAVAGQIIRQRILDETELPASIGISTNKLVSKVASDMAKPAGDPRLAGPGEARQGASNHPFMTSEGVLVVPPGKEAEFLAPLPLVHLPGCGKVTKVRFESMGIYKVQDLAALDENQVKSLGDAGRSLWHRSHGIGSQQLTTDYRRKSISKERTFREDISDHARLRTVLHKLTEGIATILRSKGLFAKTVTIKLRYRGFETHTHAKTLSEPTDVTSTLFETGVKLFEEQWDRQRPVRLLGIGVSNLVANYQGDLFAQAGEDTEHRRLAAVDRLRERYGRDILLSGESVNAIEWEDGESGL